MQGSHDGQGPQGGMAEAAAEGSRGGAPTSEVKAAEESRILTGVAEESRQQLDLGRMQRGCVGLA